MCYIIFSSVWIVEWPSFGKELLTRLTICSLCILTIYNVRYFPFWFEDWVWDLIASFPGFCILFTSIHVRHLSNVKKKIMALVFPVII